MTKSIIILFIFLLSLSTFASTLSYECGDVFEDEFTVNLMPDSGEIEIIGPNYYIKSKYDIKKEDDIAGVVRTTYTPRDREECPLVKFIHMTKIKATLLHPCEITGPLIYWGVCHPKTESLSL